MKIKLPAWVEKILGKKKITIPEKSGKVLFLTRNDKTIQVQKVNNKWEYKLYERKTPKTL